MSVDALGRAASIHYVMLPEPDLYACCDDPVIRRQMARLMMAIEMGRVLRERRTISLKMPVRRIVLCSADNEVLEDIQSLESYLKEELNCLEVIYDHDESVWCKCSISPEFSVLGRKLGKNFKSVVSELAKLTGDDVKKLEADHKLMVAGFELAEDELVVKREFVSPDKCYEGCVSSDHSFIVAIDTTQDEEVCSLGVVREFINRVQKLRKAAGLVPTGRIKVFTQIEDESVLKVIEAYRKTIEERLDCSVTINLPVPESEVVIKADEDEINGAKVMFTITRN